MLLPCGFRVIPLPFSAIKGLKDWNSQFTSAKTLSSQITRGAMARGSQENENTNSQRKCRDDFLELEIQNSPISFTKTLWFILRYMTWYGPLSFTELLLNKVWKLSMHRITSARRSKNPYLQGGILTLDASHWRFEVMWFLDTSGWSGW